ncbi:unnamed protein product [Effrenium voratum]|uniref:Uncharacterized protein n=1 Tax=Effrenium voratum TaxID=2562239 RepID=A0AA36I917_9DINO|nr:unnamed protein product [Effrenium voratum]
MPLCGSGTALARHAARLRAAEPCEPGPRMLFPMYTVPLEDVFQMSSVEPYETLTSRGVLVEFQKEMGKAIFVSHQWATKEPSGGVLDAASWRTRGWCRSERTMRELSGGSWILVQSATQIELAWTNIVTDGLTGQGHFAVAEDKARLGPVLAAALRRKMIRALRDLDFVTFRCERNLQSVHLKGLDVDPEPYLIPGEGAHASPTTDFLHQNGFRQINEVDSGGFMPVHYAALNGDPKLMKSLLEDRADFTKRTRKSQALLGSGPGVSALALCSFFGHNQAANQLISAKANVREGGMTPALSNAALGSNIKGVHILCDLGADLEKTNTFGQSALRFGCAVDSAAVVEELLSRSGRKTPVDLSKLLHAAAVSIMGGAQVTRRLIELKADLNEQYQVPGYSVEHTVLKLQSVRYRLGIVTNATRLLHHYPGATPLMLAILAANYQTAWILITEGAWLNLRNSRGFSAKDLADMTGVPDVILEALNGEAVYQRL